MSNYTYEVSTALGPSERSKCPHCGNSSQNAIPGKDIELRRCGSCKAIFYVNPTELLNLIRRWVWEANNGYFGEMDGGTLALLHESEEVLGVY